MYFRPFFWLTFFSLPSLLVLLMLGFWQLDRLAWKTELIESLMTGQIGCCRPA